MMYHEAVYESLNNLAIEVILWPIANLYYIKILNNLKKSEYFRPTSGNHPNCNFINKLTNSVNKQFCKHVY